MSATAPELQIDPSSLEFLRDPHPHHVELREAAPVVRLSRYNVWTSARSLGWPEARLHYEFFAGKVVHTDTDGAFEVKLARSRRIIKVAKDQTIVQALQASGLAIRYRASKAFAAPVSPAC